MDLFYITDWAIVPLLIWSIFWKAYGVWTASKNDHKKWFVALLVLNTLGILEIFYLFKIAKKKWSDVKEILQFNMNSKNESPVEAKIEESKS